MQLQQDAQNIKKLLQQKHLSAMTDDTDYVYNTTYTATVFISAPLASIRDAEINILILLPVTSIHKINRNTGNIHYIQR